MDSRAYHSLKNPIETANVFSKLLFWWFRKVVWKSYKHGLTEEDLYDRLDEDAAHDLGDKLEKIWDKQLASSKERGRKPSLPKALFAMFWKRSLLCGLMVVTEFVIIRTTQPLLLGKVVEFFTPGSDMTLGEAYGYTASLAVAMLVRVLIWHHYARNSQLIGMRIRVACCSLIYRKVLRLSRQTMDTSTTGYIVNLMTNDVCRFDRLVMWMHFLWMPFPQIAIIMYWLYTYVRWASFVGLVYAILITVPSHVAIGKLSKKYRAQVAVRTDERMKMMNEIVSGMRVIKMYGWETPFAKLVALARKKEILKVTRVAHLRNYVLGVQFFVDRSSLFLTLFAFWLSGNLATTAQVFSMTQFFNTMNLCLGVTIPLASSYIGEGMASMKRVQEFLLKPEVKEVFQDESAPLGEARFRKATATWDGSLHALKDFTLRVPAGQLCAIVGQVGSGKSSVLQALLGELQPSSGSVSVHGRVSYASQEPWVFVGSVRDNILLGRPYRRDWYRKVIRACALERDFQLLPRGDATLVGQKGASLSGGQRARIGLARAVYDEADIYLLDDPLSAVDTHVGKHLFQQCVCSLLAGKTRILVTHQIQHLHAADNIVVLSEGSIETQGTFNELAVKSTAFAAILNDDQKDGESETMITATSNEQVLRRGSALSTVSSVQAEDTPQDLAEDPQEEALAPGAFLRSLSGYALAAGSCFVLTAMAVLMISGQVAVSMCDYWLSYWTQWEDTRLVEPEGAPTSSWLVTVYGVLILLVAILTTARAGTFVALCMRASRRLHNTMFEQVLRAPMLFFDTNPSGRILNRFSKDIGAIDELLPFPMLDLIQLSLCISAIAILVLITQYLTIVPLVFVTVLFVWLSRMVITAGRNVKHLEGIRRSPVFSHLSDTLNGLATVRSSRVQDLVTLEFDNHQDRHTSAWFLYLCNGATLGLWLDVLSIIYVALVSFSFLIINPGSTGGSSVGLAISQSLMLTGLIQVTILQLNETLSQATSVERVLEYTRLQPEPHLDSEPGKEPPAKWPSEGSLIFKDVTLKYGKEAPAVLKDVSFKIEPTYKVGIVGRTGAGKSSLLAALFRLSPIEGSVLLDDVDTASVGLHDLRRRISIIPQEPVLFSASMRFNLDPFSEFTDDKLWAALEEVELKSVVPTLDALVTEGGGNLSVGQRQLVCLARAILRNNKVLVLDEATANVDPETDILIQKAIRTKFRECTVLTIAHRLHTIMDSDRVLVMDAGQVAEFGPPHELLQRVEGVFTGMVRQTGSGMERQLREIAQQAYMESVKTGRGEDTD